jgi:hypothetical protein
VDDRQVSLARERARPLAGALNAVRRRPGAPFIKAAVALTRDRFLDWFDGRSSRD